MSSLLASDVFAQARTDLQAKSHGLAGKAHVKAGAEAKKEGHKAEADARKDAARAEYHEQK